MGPASCECCLLWSMDAAPTISGVIIVLHRCCRCLLPLLLHSGRLLACRLHRLPGWRILCNAAKSVAAPIRPF